MDVEILKYAASLSIVMIRPRLATMCRSKTFLRPLTEVNQLLSEICTGLQYKPDDQEYGFRSRLQKTKRIANSKKVGCSRSGSNGSAQD